MPNLRLVAVCTALTGLALAIPGAASAGIFGTAPLAISIDPSAGAPNGTSSNPAVSGDDRKTRFAAFDSSASNLVRGDTNGATDVFLWARPHGSAGLTLARPTGALQRVSVTSSGAQANGDSSHPSLDGSLQTKPRCVAFQSTASNLTPGDRDAVSDVFVRNFARHKTLLVSRGIAAPAGNASIAGNCRHVAFEAAGKVYVAGLEGGKPKSLGSGSQPSYSRDGRAVAWVRGGTVMLKRNGRTSAAGPGAHPTVSDEESGVWGVTFDTRARLAGNDGNPGSDVYMRVFRRSGGAKRTDLISATRRGGQSLGGDSYNGGLTSYAANRGIVVFVTQHGGTADLWYRNNHSGNIDDLAHASSITDVVTSARANFVAFTSGGGGRASFTGDTGGMQSVFFKHLVDGTAI